MGLRVSGLRRSSVKDPTPKDDKRSTLPMPKNLTPATCFSFPLNVPARFGSNVCREHVSLTKSIDMMYTLYIDTLCFCLL